MRLRCFTDTAAWGHKYGCVISSSFDVKNRMLSDKKEEDTNVASSSVSIGQN
jgi:hypothetical protein